MITGFRRNNHLSHVLQSLRLEHVNKPGQLVARLGASNISKVGSLIRAFELGEPLSDHWLQKLISYLQPDPAELRFCLALDQSEADKQLELDREVCGTWADQPIQPFLTIRCMPALFAVREDPQAFCTTRETAEDNAWARVRAEEWAADELKRFRAKGFLNWSRRERTWYDECGHNPRHRAVTFDDRHTGAYMQLTGSQQKFLLSDSGDLITRSYGLDQPVKEKRTQQITS